MSNLPEVHFYHRFENELTLLGEHLPWLNSVSFDIAIPAGSAYDPEGRYGLAALTTEMLLRGAGPRNARQFLEDLENLGVIWSESVGHRFIHLNAAMRANQLLPALSIFRDVLLSPHLPKGELESARQGLIQEILASEDDPEQKLEKELRYRFLPHPWNRPTHGKVEDVAGITWDEVAGFVERQFRPAEAVIAIAGQFDWHHVVSAVGELLAGWEGSGPPLPESRWSNERRVHVPFDSQQTHIGVAYPCVPYEDSRYFIARATVGMLGGGTSARLFMELREKRGLCYTVTADYLIIKGFGGVFCYAGTTAERAHETLALLFRELHELPRGICESELARVKAQLKSGLVFHQESSAARARAMITDWSLLGRIRPVHEIKEAADALTTEGINRFLQENPPRHFTVVTLGPEPVEVPCEIL